MATNKTIPVTKHCVVCDEPFLVCPPGKTSRTYQRSHEDQYCSRQCRYRARYRVGSNCKPLSDTDAAYIAGFLDGEGSIMIYARGDAANLRVSFSNTKKPVLDWIRERCDIGNIVSKQHDNPLHATSYMLLINGQAAFTLLLQVEKYLILKRKQAIIGIDFAGKLSNPKLKADREWQYQARDAIKLLNKRGN